MAYNREWDRGKDTWADGAQWPGANVRPREDDHYGDGKRRKFNSGGYQGYDAYSNYEEAAYDSTAAPRPSAQDFGQPRNTAGGFPKKRLQPSDPSPHVIFLGLDTDFTEADLQAYLSSNGCSVETVTIIRDRSTGTSKGFGFAQFSSTDHARLFVDPLFPYIQVPPPASHGATAAAAFYKALETGAPHSGRRVKIDYSQSATPHEKGRFNRGNVNDGTRDIGNSQAAVLLFRGLDPLSGPQAIHQAMRSSSGPGKEGAKGMRRIILIKDRVTMASFGFAFVEFTDVQSASVVLAATMSPQIHPSGFRISDRPVAASFAHPDSFQPIDNVMLRDDACIPSSLVLGGVEGTWVRYWDDSSTLAMLEFQVAQPAPAAQTVKEKKEKKKAKDTTIQRLSVQPAPSALPVSDKPVTLSFSKGPAKAAASTVKKSVASAFASDDADDDQQDEAEDLLNASRKAGTSKPPTLIVSKKIASNINKWNQVQEELSQDPFGIPRFLHSGYYTCRPRHLRLMLTGPLRKHRVHPPKTIRQRQRHRHRHRPSSSSRMSALMSCLLCARQFKSVDQLKRHNKESDLHKKNLKDSNLQEVARQKVKARQASAVPKYRDRASERRILFNQPETPMPEKDSGWTAPRRQVEGPPVASPLPLPPPPPTNPGEDSNNVGNKMLKMMGWTEGTGLGTSGEGRIDPIKTAIYVEGAGLGASKGKDIGKLTEGYSGYVSMAQDSARERYGS
ncbi:uncharacterized protein EV420DRAFT_269842 [Desarmillaria tabescens]|uniref:G-patch domain-containing protein n=1 Tax=Armillaria tabescens TaxID=1929756 RepID=A0AA39KE57_ARMTA|nr:uncharacterized protein EV420DRAFT_269842 [Desarmillaria tabescens]KAK0459501.1 hypothetical protein EV420DRAFT_269842 [Desarmillaria tabescens]